MRRQRKLPPHFKQPNQLVANFDRAVRANLSRREIDAAALGDCNRLLPAKAERRAGNERIDLERHVGHEFIIGARLHPRSLDFDKASAVAGAVEVVVALTVLFVELDEALGDLGSENTRLEVLFCPVVSIETELNELALLGRKLAAANGKTDRRRITANLRGEVQLNDIAFLDDLVAGAGNRVTRRLLGEAVHRKTFVFSTVFVDALLGNANELKLGLARLKLSHDSPRSKLSDARSFADASDFVVALDAAQSEHNVVGPNNLGLRIALANTFELHAVRVELGSNTDLDVLARDTELREDVLERFALKLRISRVGAFAILVNNSDVLHPAEVTCEDLALGANHEHVLTVGGNRSTNALKDRPEIREVTRISIVGLGAVHNENVKPLLGDKLRCVGNALLELFNWNLYSSHFAFSFLVLVIVKLLKKTISHKREAPASTERGATRPTCQQIH